MSDKTNLCSLEGLGLVDLELCPHVERFEKKYVNFAERLKTFENNKSVELLKLRDGEAYFIKDSSSEIL